MKSTHSTQCEFAYLRPCRELRPLRCATATVFAPARPAVLPAGDALGARSDDVTVSGQGRIQARPLGGQLDDQRRTRGAAAARARSFGRTG